MKTLMLILTGFILPGLVLAQGAGDRARSKVYKPPEREEWLNAGLDPVEYDMAVRYEVTLEDWKKMSDKRKANKTAGWALIGVGLLTPAVEVTVHFASDYKFKNHPEQEAYIVISVAAGLCILTGIILVATAPGPDDFKSDWLRRSGTASFYVAPSFGGAVLGFNF